MRVTVDDQPDDVFVPCCAAFSNKFRLEAKLRVEVENGSARVSVTRSAGDEGSVHHLIEIADPSNHGVVYKSIIGFGAEWIQTADALKRALEEIARN